MNAFAGIRPKGVKTRPPSFFPWRLQWGLSILQWGSNPHNPPPPPILPWSECMSVCRRSVSNCISCPYVVYFCLFSPLKDRYAFSICLQLLRPLPPTGALPLDPAGGFPSPRPPVLSPPLANFWLRPWSHWHSFISYGVFLAWILWMIATFDLLVSKLSVAYTWVTQQTISQKLKIHDFLFLI